MAIQAKWADFGNLDRDRLIAILNGRMPSWVALLLAALIAWQLARIVWLLVPASGSGDPVMAVPPASGSSISRGSSGADTQAIATAHLFGEATEAPVVQVVPDEPVEDLAETRLALTLKGTMAGSDNRLTVAIIADNRNEEKVYTINDAVAPGATLHSVYADRVVLNRSGSLEVLKLPKDFPKTTAPVMRQPTTVSRAADEPGTDNQTIQDVVAQNVTKLADIIRPTPYFEGGQQQGYRVYPGRDRKQFAALGLRPGDLIKDIDGQALTDPQQAMQIFQSLGDSDQVSVTVERNGQPQVLVLTTGQLTLEETDQ